MDCREAAEPAVLTILKEGRVLYPVHWPMDYSNEKAFQAQAAAISIRDTVKESIKQR
jgi:hypothetical protein